MNIRRIGKGSAQVITKDDGTQVLISYSTPVACLIPSQGYYRTEKKFSVTTSKHVNQWLEGVQAIVRPQSFFDALI